jgi:hypothetical protein
MSRSQRAPLFLAFATLAVGIAGCNWILNLTANDDYDGGGGTSTTEASKKDASIASDGGKARDATSDAASIRDAPGSETSTIDTPTNCQILSTIAPISCDESTSYCSLYYNVNVGTYVWSCRRRATPSGAEGSQAYPPQPGQCGDKLVSGPDWVDGYKCGRVCRRDATDCPKDFYCAGIAVSLDGTSQTKDDSVVGVCARCDPAYNRGCPEGTMCGVLDVNKPPQCMPIGPVPSGGKCATGAECEPATSCVCGENFGTCAPDSGIGKGDSGTCLPLCHDYERGKKGQCAALDAICSSIPGQPNTTGSLPPLYSFCKAP